MSPILGIWASATRQGLSTTSYESIATVAVGSGGASSISFTSIPSTYKHLQIRYLARATTTVGSTSYNFAKLTFNSSTTGYATHYLFGTGSAVTAGGEANTSAFPYVYTTSAASIADTFAVGIIDILDYENTNKNKTLRYLGGWDVNGGTGGSTAGYVMYQSGLWANTNAITSITIDGLQSSGNFAQYSHFALYGLKSA